MSTRPSRWVKTLAAAAATFALSAAQAQVLPVPLNVVSLTATASVEVDKDWLTVVFNTTKEAGEAASVQSQLKVVLDQALTEARKAARPGQVEVQTGAFSLAPRYSSKGSINGWQGSTELVVQGRDVAAISQLTGRIQGLTISRVGVSLSREARAKVDADITAEAITRFRARAEAVSKQFGFAGYAVREVSVASDQGGPSPVPMLRARAMSAGAADESLSVEAGKAVVTATVTGSVQMK
jgi:predicted secreted protein